MLLSFDAKQKLKLSVKRNKEYLSKYLLEEERVVGAMLDSKKLVPEGVGRYKYTVTSFRVFQLDIKPVVSIAVENKGDSKFAIFDKIWAAFSAYVPWGPKYAICLRMINLNKKGSNKHWRYIEKCF